MSENTAGSRYEVSVAPRDVATAPSEDFAAVDAVGVAREREADLVAVFNRAYAGALKGPTASLAIFAAVRAVASRVRAECAAEARG